MAKLETYETLEGDPAAARAVAAFAAERPTRCRMCVGALGVTVAAVKWHLQHIYEKLHVHSRTEAALKFQKRQSSEN